MFWRKSEGEPDSRTVNYCLPCKVSFRVSSEGGGEDEIRREMGSCMVLISLQKGERRVEDEEEDFVCGGGKRRLLQGEGERVQTWDVGRRRQTGATRP